MIKKIRTMSALMGVIFQVFSSPAVAIEQEHYSINPAKSQLNFSVQSSLHPIQGVVHHFSGTLLVERSADLLRGKGDVKIPVRDMETGNGLRDKKMREMLRIKTFPDIICRISALTEQAGGKGRVQGELVIAESARPFDTEVAIERLPEGFMIRGNMSISLRNYGLKPPSILKLIKVADAVNVKFDVKMEHEQEAKVL